MSTSDRGRGATLIEVIVVLGILAVLVALLLPAVQSARLSAIKAEAFNGGRQLLLATHQYAGQHKDQLVDYDGATRWDGASIVRELCPYLEADPNDPPAFVRLRSDPSDGPTAPSVHLIAPAPDRAPPRPCSYAFNAVCYAYGQTLKGVTDGLSNTVGLAEHYGSCQSATYECHFVGSIKRHPDGTPRVQSRVGFRRTTFADYPMYDDVRPLTTTRDGRPHTIPNLPLTFQVRPALGDCDPRIPQSSLPGGMMVGLLDGSVRFVRPEVAPEVFWGSVTPAAGEVVTLD